MGTKGDKTRMRSLQLITYSYNLFNLFVDNARTCVSAPHAPRRVWVTAQIISIRITQTRAVPALYRVYRGSTHARSCATLRPHDSLPHTWPSLCTNTLLVASVCAFNNFNLNFSHKRHEVHSTRPAALGDYDFTHVAWLLLYNAYESRWLSKPVNKDQ